MKSVASLALLGLTLLLWALITRQPPAIETSNQSGLVVTEMLISVGEFPVARSGLGPRDIERHSVPLRREGPLTVALRFANGEQGQFQAGWFSPGQSHLTRIVIISPDSVRIND